MASKRVMYRRGCLAWACVAAGSLGPVWGQELLRESGDFRDEIDRQKGIINTYFSANTYNFVVPTSSDLTYFRTMCETLRSGNLVKTASLANAVNYDLVQYKDTAVNRTYYMLRERNNSSRKGWGSFVYNFSYTTDIAVEVPHVLYDQNTEDVGARTLQATNARCFTIAGAHRACCGTIDDRVGGVSDPTWESATVFQSAHKAFNGPAGKTVGWQIHGFGSSTDEPAGAGALLADGSGRVGMQHRFLDNALEQRGIASYVYNDYSASGAINREVNATVTASGTVTYVNGWDLPLNAKQNVQANFSSSSHSGATFVHIELSAKWRAYPSSTYSTANRSAVANAIADAATRVSLTSNYWTGGAGTGTFGNDTNWDGGTPGSSEDGLFGATVNGTYYTPPANVLFYNQTQTSRTITWNAPTATTFAAANSSTAPTRVWTLRGDGVNNIQPLFWTTTNFASGTIIFSDANYNTAGGPPLVVRLGGPGAFRIDSPNAVVRMDSQITEDIEQGPQTLEKTGAGTLILNNISNAFTGGVRLSGGTVQISDFRQTGQAPTELSASHLIFNGGTLSYTGASASPNSNYGIFLSHESSGALNIANSAATLTLTSPITGNGALIKTGPGTLLLASDPASFTYTGGLIIKEGTVSISNIKAIGQIPESAETQLTISGGTLQWTGSAATTAASNRRASWGAAGATIDVTQSDAELIIAGNISGSGRLTKQGPGTLTLTGSNSTTGGFRINGGNLAIGQTNDLGPTPSSLVSDYIHLAGGTFQWTGSTAAFNANRGVHIAGGGIHVLADTTLTLPTISGPGQLVKSGAGTLAFTGTVALGGLNITAGSVALTDATMPALKLGSLAIASNQTLDIMSRALVLTDSSQASTLRTLLLNGYDGGSWDGTGIVSTSVATSGYLRTIGYAANTFGYTNFFGVTVSPNDLLVAYTFFGDANLDGQVDDDDLSLISPTGTTWSEGDFNYDGVVNQSDLDLFTLGRVISSSFTPPVPEPVSLAWLPAFAFLLHRRRK